MKAKTLFTSTAVSLMAVTLASPLQAQQNSIFESAGAETKGSIRISPRLRAPRKALKLYFDVVGA